MRALLPRVLLVALLAVGACSDGDLDGAHPELPAALERARANHPEAARRNVVLLGMDSLDPDLMDKYIAQGKTPNFARLRREGASGGLASLSPLLSPVVWTTIATGMPPERHGVLDFVTDTPEGPRPVTSRMRQADTLWSLISRAGGSVGVVGWLVTWPAEKVNGFLVTERMGLLAYEAGRQEGEAIAHRTYPEELAAELDAQRVTIDDLPVAAIRPFADVTDEEYGAAYSPVILPTTNIPPDVRQRHLLGNLRLTLATAETFRRVGQRLLRKERPRFFACYFEAMDALSHYFMRYAPPRLAEIPEDEYLRFRTAIEANYVWHDQVLGEFMDLCDENTTLIVVSDHGFKHGPLRMPELSDFHAKTGAMWHRLYGSFYAWGRGIEPGTRLTGANVFDIAPTILAAMGYPVPDDMPGKVLEEAFTDGLPHETVPTWFGERRRMELVDDTAEADAPLTPEDEEELAKLRALGYIGGDRSDPASTVLNLGSRLRSTGRFDRAKEEFEKVLAQQENARGPDGVLVGPSPQVLFSLADVHLALAERKQRREQLEDAAAELATAEEYIARAARIAGQDVIVLWLRARLHLLRDEPAEAEKVARRSVELKPYQPAGHTLLADALGQLMDAALDAGDTETGERYRLEAIYELERALDREPRLPHVLTELAHLLLSGRRDLERDAKAAKERLDTAIELVPRSHTAFNNRAIALLRLALVARHAGRTVDERELLDEALASADRAVEIHPRYPMGFANRAYVLWHMGRLDEAFESAMKAREFNLSYGFFAAFQVAMAEAGKPIPAPAPR